MATEGAIANETDYGLVLDGEVVAAENGDTTTVENPATEEVIADVALATENDIDRAVESGEEAFEEWQSLQPAERGRLLTALARAIRDEAERFQRLLTLENGMSASAAETYVEETARYFEYYAGMADKIQGETVPLGDEYVDYTIKEPYGVTGQIVPWNFPMYLFGRSVAPALASGNVAVVKPALLTPLTAVELGKLALDVGIPDGVINVVPGQGSVAGARLASHPDIGAISFTGSGTTGKKVAQTAAENVTPVHIELGGKSPVVVYDDADFDNAVDNAITAIFSEPAGQICSAGSRALVHEDIYDDFVDELGDRVETLTVGPGLEDPDMGPVASEDQFEMVMDYIDIGRTEVGEPVVGGGALDRDGYFIEPTIFADVDNDMRIAQEEVFGPFLTITPFSDEQEALELANDVDYGLVSGVFTTDVNKAHRFARDVEAGMVFVNEWFAGGVETPFGGFKESGWGREKGLEALDEFTQTKNVCANISL